MGKKKGRDFMNADGSLKKQKRTGKYCIVYTAFFAVTAFFVFAVFVLSSKSFVCKIDGITQHYRALIYYGQWLREIVRNVFVNRTFIIPQWSFSLGLGNDIVTTMSYYVLGDPLNLLAVLFKSESMGILYNGLIILRLYLAGLAFSYYFMLRNKDYSRYGLIIGSLCYVFCGFTMYMSVEHPYFTNPMIYLPLILAGAEKIIEGRRPYLFILSVAVSAVSNMYFFYMIVIITVVYVLIRLAFTFGNDFKKAVKPFIITAVCSVVGVSIGAVTLVPMIVGILSDGRISSQSTSFLVYSVGYYIKLVTSFLTVGTAGYTSRLGFCAISLPAVIVLFMRKGENKQLKLFFIVSTACLFIPAVGKLMNGFSYVTNRWVFAYCLVVSYITALMTPEIFKLNVKQVRTAIAVCLIYAVPCCAVWILEISSETDVIVSFALALVILFAVGFTLGGGEKKRSFAKKLVSVVTVLGIAFSAFSLYDSHLGAYENDFVSLGRLNREVNNTQDLSVIKAEEKDSFDGFSRYEHKGGKTNSQLNHGTYATQYYWSISNSAVYDLRSSLSLKENRPQKYSGFDSRAALMALTNVRYFVSKDKKSKIVPYGFDSFLSDKENGYNVYINENYLPFGYTYSSVMSEEYYNGLSAVQRQEALLQNALVENAESLPLELKEAQLDSQKLKYKVTKLDKGVAVGTDGSFVVTKPKKSVELTVYDADGEGEYYACFKGFNFKQSYLYDIYKQAGDIDPKDTYTEKDWNKLSTKTKLSLLIKKLTGQVTSMITVNIKAMGADGTQSNSLEYRTERDQYYMGCHDYDVNLGYREKGLKTVKIIFPEAGVYSFDELLFYRQPMKNYSGQLNVLKEDVLEKTEFFDNGIKGEITLTENKLLCMSVPYSKGWTAYVDGKETDIVITNKMCVGLMLEPGAHTVELKYSTPGLKLGTAITFLGLLIFAAYVISCEIIYKKKQTGKTADGKVDLKNGN